MHRNSLEMSQILKDGTWEKVQMASEGDGDVEQDERDHHTSGAWFNLRGADAFVLPPFGRTGRTSGI